MELALLTRPDAAQPSHLLTADSPNELRRRIALIPATGWCVAVQVHDPIDRTSVWHVLHPLNPDGSVRSGIWLTMRGGICRPQDARRLWDTIRANMAWHRNGNACIRALRDWVK